MDFATVEVEPVLNTVFIIHNLFAGTFNDCCSFFVRVTWFASSVYTTATRADDFSLRFNAMWKSQRMRIGLFLLYF